MKSRTTAGFRKGFMHLPAEVQRQARQVYERWKKDASHPSLDFKQIHSSMPIYSVRIGLHWRALAYRRDYGWLWYWIGSHADYDKLLK
jgi:hypothetical protein